MIDRLAVGSRELDWSSLSLTGSICLWLLTMSFGEPSEAVADTCGHYFFMPMFPSCDLYLEIVPCYNDTLNVLVTLSTPAGDVLKSLNVVFGSMSELPLRSLHRGKSEGLILRSNEDISAYIHNSSGDSMVVFPVDAFARDYEIPRLMTQKTFSSTRLRNSGKKLHDGALYLFSPFNNTSITIMQLQDSALGSIPIPTVPSSFPPLVSPSVLSSSPLSGSSSSVLSTTTVKLDAFQIYEYHISTRRRYRLHSVDAFAVILLQTSQPFPEEANICQDVKLLLLDFVPPFSVRGKYFYIAFPRVTDLSLAIMGPDNTTLDLTTDLMSQEILLDTSGKSLIDVRGTTSAWLTASLPVSVYVRLTLCSNGSSPNATSGKLCADNGFFLPSVEHYFSCRVNLTSSGCLCSCPSVFQRDLNPVTFPALRNSSKPRPTTIYPLLVGELHDVTTTITNSLDFKNSEDIIVTTNTSFLIFRYDLDNLNFLPAGMTLANIYRICPPNFNTVLYGNCQSGAASLENLPENVKEESDNTISTLSRRHCSCEFVQDSVFVPTSGSGDSNPHSKSSGSTRWRSSSSSGGGEEFVWVEEDEDTARPLIAVVVSLCVSIFAVIGMISGYMLVEMMSHRKHVRNTKIRPFVS